MYTLYYAPGTCSLAIHALLNELNQPYELKKVDISGKDRDPEFLKLNPLGAVPVLVDDGQVIREGAAIMLYLMEKHPTELLPEGGVARTQALQWLMFANATMHPTYGKVFVLLKQVPPSPQRDEIIAKFIQAINKQWALVDEQLSKYLYVAGDKITAADLLLTVFASWGASFTPKIELGKNVKRLVGEVSQRPAFLKTLEEEEVTYKTAA